MAYEPTDETKQAAEEFLALTRRWLHDIDSLQHSLPASLIENDRLAHTLMAYLDTALTLLQDGSTLVVEAYTDPPPEATEEAEGEDRQTDEQEPLADVIDLARARLAKTNPGAVFDAILHDMGSDDDDDA